jgi:hypothetical protein
MIEFIRPQQGDYVSQHTDVEYRINGSIPQGYREVLLVQNPLGQYWSWGATIDHRQAIQLSVVEDRGRRFNIVVLITNQDIPKGITYQNLSQGIYHKSITVTRQ